MGDNTSTSRFTGKGEREEKNIAYDKEREPYSSENAKNEIKETKNANKSHPKSSINSPINASNWEDILTIIGTPGRHVLTKESYELTNAVLGAYEYVIMHNIYDFIKEASTNACFHERLLKFLTVSKIGASLSQFKQIRLNAIIQAITQQASMYNTALQQLGAVATSFSNAYILREVITTAPPSTDIQVPNVAIDIKVSTIIATLIGSLVAIGTEIGNLKNDMRTQIAIDEYCLQGCSPECISMTLNSIKELRSMLNDNNEGLKLKEYADKALTWLDKLVSIELEYLSKQLERKEGIEVKKE